MKKGSLTTVLGTALTLAVVAAAAPAFAQEPGIQQANGYTSAFGGAVWAGGNSTGSVLFEGGARIAPHIMGFGNVGRFSDLRADLNATLDSAKSSLSNQGFGIIDESTLPAWYGIGGVRAEMFATKRALPYVLGGIGAARLDPTTRFTFSSGILPDGSAPSVGTDVTATLESMGSLSEPASSTAFMFMLGGGAQIPLASRWAADVGYRYSRIAADDALSATALNTNAITFGVGYRF